MAAGVLFINGRDVTTVGFALMEAPTQGGVARTYATAAIPGRMGSVLTQADPLVAPRTLTFKGLIGTPVSTLATLDAAIDTIKAWCAAGLVEIRHVYNTTKLWYGYLADDTGIQQQELTVLDGYAYITLTFLCPDPLAYALSMSTVSFGAAGTTLPLSTAALSPRTFITNATAAPLVNFTLTQTDAAGNVIATMTLTGSLATGEQLDIDHAAMSIWKMDAAGVRTSARSWFTAGTYFTLHAGDRLKVNQGSGLAQYWKASL
jgi:hypothetical protein